MAAGWWCASLFGRLAEGLVIMLACLSNSPNPKCLISLTCLAWVLELPVLIADGPVWCVTLAPSPPSKCRHKNGNRNQCLVHQLVDA